MPHYPRELLATFVVAFAASLAACSSGLGTTGGLDGCLTSDRGTIAIGVTNTAGEPLSVSAVSVAEGSGVDVVDQFIAPNEEARDTAALFSTGGRDEFGGVALDRAMIAPGAAAYVGIEVERTGSTVGTVNGLIVTADGTESRVPVTLVLRDSCD